MLFFFLPRVLKVPYDFAPKGVFSEPRPFSHATAAIAATIITAAIASGLTMLFSPRKPVMGAVSVFVGVAVVDVVEFLWTIKTVVVVVVDGWVVVVVDVAGGKTMLPPPPLKLPPSEELPDEPDELEPEEPELAGAVEVDVDVVVVADEVEVDDVIEVVEAELLLPTA